MKRSKKCPKCSSLQIGYLGYQPDIGDQAYSVRAVGVVDREGFFGTSVQLAVGTLEAYVCTECGYYESYVVSPTRFDWGKVNGLVMLNAPKPTKQDPYR